MSNRIDQLFRDSLKEHKVPPSSEAWAKIHSGQSKKNKFMIAWRVAAALLLFSAIGGTLYLLNRNELVEPQQLAKTKELTFDENENKEKSKVIAAQPVNPTISKTTKSIITRKKLNPFDSQTKEDDASEKMVTENNELDNVLHENIIITEPTLITQIDKTEKPIVIEFTLESFSKPPVTEVAQVSEEEHSNLKKILEAARDVKNGESDFGIIRETKNQLFALDFRKEKIKRN